MYKVFVKDLPIILSTEENIGKQYTAIPIKEVKFKKLIKKIEAGELLYLNFFHKNPEKLEQFLREKLPVVEAAGGMVFNDKKEILFIHRNNRWDLPKGQLDKGESFETAAIREVMEETGVEGLEIKKFINKTYHVFKRNGKYKLKVTYWFEMFTNYNGKLTPQENEGIKKVKWKNFEKSQKALQNSYANIKLLFPQEYLVMHPNDRISQV